ncbi:MAG: phosphatase PAP2 family protein [Patescibacteria group bacterium]
MNKKITWFLLGLLLLVVFAVFSKYVKNGGLKNADFAVTVKIQERIDTSSRLRLVDLVGNVMEGATFFASPAFTSIIVVVLTGWAAYDRKKKHWRPGALIIPIAFSLIVMGELYGKSVVHHPAPPFYMIKNPTTIFPKFYINEEFSYPSGHAARAVFLALIAFITIRQYNNITMRKRLVLLCGLGIYVGLVFVSRIYLGHHWLSDILGGGLLGSGLAFLSIFFL